jgi:phosphatidylserine/phosphatidylglycerophosphate/cardiolipin synthase-like enzyme
VAGVLAGQALAGPGGIGHGFVGQDAVAAGVPPVATHPAVGTVSWYAFDNAPGPVAVAFNDPREPAVSGGPGQLHIRDVIDAELNAAAPGSTLQVAMYRWQLGGMAQTVVAEPARQVHTQVLLDGSVYRNGCPPGNECSKTFATLSVLDDQLTDPDTWLRSCDGYAPGNPIPDRRGAGCVGQHLNHNKVILLSQSDFPDGSQATDTVIQSSANLDPISESSGYNNALVISGNSRLYADYEQYFQRLVSVSASNASTASMRFTHATGDHTITSTIGTHDIQTYSFPRAHNDDPIARQLSHVEARHSCALSGGRVGHIDVAMTDISARHRIIRQLDRLSRGGCSVWVAYTRLSAGDHRWLSRAGVHTRQVCVNIPSSADGTRNYPFRHAFIHDKYVLVDDRDTVLGKSERRFVITGSDNWNEGSLLYADDRDIRYVEPVGDSPVFDSYLGEFHHLVDTESAHQAVYGACAKDQE